MLVCWLPRLWRPCSIKFACDGLRRGRTQSSIHDERKTKLSVNGRSNTMTATVPSVPSVQSEWLLAHQLSPRAPPIDGTYLSNFLQNTLKSNQLEINAETRGLRCLTKGKEPRDLFLLPKELDSPQQAARWPTECQVCEDRVQHVDYNPPHPEPYYQPTGHEVQPKPVGEEAGNVVFQYYPMSAVNYFSRSSVGGSRYFMPATPSERELEDELRFESRFESGNLAKVVKITDTYYELYLRTDLYTNRHMQWFYFKVYNTKANTTYRFSLVNLSKGDSLYSMGMKPLLYSTKDAKLNSIGWRRFGDNIAYYKNDSTNCEEEQAANYTLTFNLEFRYERDEVYIAHCYPYTYTDLQDYLNKLQNHPVKSTFTKLRLLCRTLAGNNVYYLTITEPSLTDEPKKKKAVVITARVHPGETPSSWMMKGFIDFLTGDSTQAKELRDKFIFKLVPMLNPDGVIVGNNRCSLTGRDLNRQYRTVIRETYPPVWHTKLMIRRLMEECGIVMYCDLHAHSRKHNVFIYGCENKRYVEKRLQEQVFPLMLHKNAADKFSFENCKFRIQRSKEGTGRVVVWMMGVANSYTMEASFAGSSLGSRIDTHFTIQDFETMGRSFCETLLDFCDEEPSKEKLRVKIIERLVKEGSSADEPTNINLSDYSSDEGDTSSSSGDENGAERGEQRIHWINKEAEYCCGLTVPPPSPQPIKESKKEWGSPKKKAVTQERSPPVARKPLAVHRTTIDPSSIGGDRDSSDESEEETASQTRTGNDKFGGAGSRHPGRQRRGRNKHMPPELIVTAAHQSSPEIKCRHIPGVGKSRSKSWHPSRRRPSDMSECENQNENRLDLRGALRSKVWTGCACNAVHSDTALSQGSVLAKAHWSKTSSDGLLRSCSQKLMALQNTISSKYGNQNKCKLKKRKSWSKKTGNNNWKTDDEQQARTDEYCQAAHAQRAVRRSAGSLGLNAATSAATHRSEKERRPIRPTSQAREGTPPVVPSQSAQSKTQRKFRTGGIVAAVISNYHKEDSNSETEPDFSDKNVKKKKKRIKRSTKNSKKNIPKSNQQKTK